jgi:hypothetical protein
VKRTRADEPVRVVIYICMETTQGNSLCSYLYLKLAKMSCFSFYLFSSAKSENRRLNRSCSEGRVASVGGSRWRGKGR